MRGQRKGGEKAPVEGQVKGQRKPAEGVRESASGEWRPVKRAPHGRVDREADSLTVRRVSAGPASPPRRCTARPSPPRRSPRPCGGAAGGCSEVLAKAVKRPRGKGRWERPRKGSGEVEGRSMKGSGKSEGMPAQGQPKAAAEQPKAVKGSKKGQRKGSGPWAGQRGGSSVPWPWRPSAWRSAPGSEGWARKAPGGSARVLLKKVTPPGLKRLEGNWGREERGVQGGGGSQGRRAPQGNTDGHTGSAASAETEGPHGRSGRGGGGRGAGHLRA